MSEQSELEKERQKFAELLPYWRNESLTHMTTVLGYTKLLLEHDDAIGTLTPTQREFLNIILRAANQSVYWWHLAVKYSQLNYWRTKIAQGDFDWSKLVDELSSNLQEHPCVETVHFEIAPDLPPIIGDLYLIPAFLYLIAPENEIRYNPEKVSPVISARRTDQFRALITINTELIFINRDEKPKHHDEIFTDGTCYWVAEAILKQYGTSVKCILSDTDNKVTFEFTLPVWTDDAKSENETLSN